MKIKNIYIAAVIAAVLASCGTQKAVVKPTTTPKPTPTNATAGQEKKQAEQEKKQQLQYVQRVSDLALYQKNVVSNLSFTVNTGKKEITVPGILHMRKDEVIRLQLLIPLLRSEVGRIEFTKDYVLFIDRMHKQYVKAKYTDVAFLKNNGINFYSLQALFWNQLFIPGEQRVGEHSLEAFNVDAAALKAPNKGIIPITLKEEKMTYRWLTEALSGFINQAEAKYTSPNHGVSTLTWNYSDFKPFGSKKFPCRHEVLIKTPIAKGQKTISATFELEGLSDNANWESFTTPSSKYEQVGVEEILGKLMQL